MKIILIFRYKVHTKCRPRIGDNCGLTVDVLKRAFDWMHQSSAANNLLNAPADTDDSTTEYSLSSPGSSTPSTPAYSSFHAGTKIFEDSNISLNLDTRVFQKIARVFAGRMIYDLGYCCGSRKAII